jgi:hypothetical protein
MREFVVSTAVTTIGSTVGSVTLIYLRATGAPNMNIEVLRWWIGQYANATSAQQRVLVGWRGTGFPTLGALTPVPMKMQDPNASSLIGSSVGSTAGIAGVNASAETTTGAATYGTGIQDAFNVLNGWLQVPTPPETWINPAGHGSGLALVFPTQPTTAGSWNFGVNFREV